jgi:hypothetical protein
MRRALRLGAHMPCTAYIEDLDKARGIYLFVEFHRYRAEVLDYALVLAVEQGGRLRTVRVYDAAHGRNEMHRYTTKLGKQPGVVFHHGTLGEGMRAAKQSIRGGYEEMIEGWR